MLRPATSLRTPSRTFFAELFAAPGPHVIGQTGDNSYPVLFGRVWVLEVRDDGELRLHQRQTDGSYARVVDDLPPVFASGAPPGSRRWSLAFDQAARVILAYEDAEGVVRVTRWDASLNEYVQNVTFSGADPVVVMDASWRYLVPGSDVLLFYLSPDRERVLCRVQREAYAVEHEIWDYETPVILDRVIPAFIKFQILLSDIEGEPLPDALVSSIYPYPGRTPLLGSVSAARGIYKEAYLFNIRTPLVASLAVVSAEYTLQRETFTLDPSPDSVSGEIVTIAAEYRRQRENYFHTPASPDKVGGAIHISDKAQYIHTRENYVHTAEVSAAEGGITRIGGTYVES